MIGLVLAIACVIVSVACAISRNEWRSPMWWVLLAIFATQFFGAKAPF
jgi:uncharacterized membrane protein